MGSREDKRAAFDEQMNVWLSKQGFWFQLRHASGSESIAPRILGVFSRLLVILFVCAVGIGIYLVKRVDSDSFRENMRSSIEGSLKGQDCQVGGFKKEGETATLRYVKMEGTEESFFHQLRADRVQTSMTLFDGVLGSWKGRSLSVGQLDINVKAGASDDANAAASFQSLFIPQEGFEFDRIECKDTNITWGYSKLNLGGISGSRLLATRNKHGWKLEFKEGSFSQSWLQDLRIKNMEVLCSKQGIVIQKAEFTAKDGSGSFTISASIGSGAQPDVEGDISIKHMPVESLLSPAYATWIQGEISGKGKIGGSTNSQEGITLDLDLNLKDEDVLLVRDKLPLLSALSVMDIYNSYRKVSFTEGGFQVYTGGDLIQLSAFNLKAGDLLHLQGDVKIRPPTHQEIAKALEIDDVSKVTDILDRNSQIVREALSSDDSDQPDKPRNQNFVNEVFKTAIIDEVNVKRFTGNLKLGLTPNVFEKLDELRKIYPVDPSSGRVWIDVPMNDRFQTLTLRQAEDLYVKGRYRNN